MNFPKTISEYQNLSKILILLLYIRLTDFLDVRQGLINIDPQSVQWDTKGLSLFPIYRSSEEQTLLLGTSEINFSCPFPCHFPNPS